MFARLESELGGGPFFAGESFSLVDAVFAPVFRYFDGFDRLGDFGILAGKPKLAAWRKALAARPSVRSAVVEDFPERLLRFFDGAERHTGEKPAGGLKGGTETTASDTARSGDPFHHSRDRAFVHSSEVALGLQVHPGTAESVRSSGPAARPVSAVTARCARTSLPIRSRWHMQSLGERACRQAELGEGSLLRG